MGIAKTTRLNCFIIKFIFAEPKQVHVVSTAIDMPEGVDMSDVEDGNAMHDANDPHRALDIDLDEPMEQRAGPKRPPQALKTMTTTSTGAVAVALADLKKSTTDKKTKKKKTKKSSKDDEDLIDEGTVIEG